MMRLETLKKVNRYAWVAAGLIALTAGGVAAWARSPGGHSSLNAELIDAARSGNGTEVRFLLTLGADPNAQGKNGDTALIAATYAPESSGPIVTRMIDGHMVCHQDTTPAAYGEIVHALMSAGADPKLANRQGMTAITRAQEIHAYDYLPELTAGIRGLSKGGNR